MDGRGHAPIAATRSSAAIGVILGLGAGAMTAVAGPLVGSLSIGAVVGAIAAAFAPGFVLAAYLLIPFYKGALQPFIPVDITLLLAGLNVVQVVPLALDRRPWRPSGAGIVLWALVAGLVVAGVLYAPDQALALSTALAYWALVFVPISIGGARVARDERFLAQFLWTFFAMGVVTVASGIALLSDSSRLTLLGANTIGVARAALLVPVVGCAFVLRVASAPWRAFTIVLIPPALLVSVASGSRGPLLMLFVLALIVGIVAAPRLAAASSRLLVGVALLVISSVVVVAAAAAALPEVSTERFARLGEFVQGFLAGDVNTAVGDTSAGTRLVLFRLAASIFEQHPVFGVGTAGFAALSPRYLSPLEAEAYPHDAILQFAAEFGVLGILLFAGLVFIALARRLPPGVIPTAIRVIFAFFLLNAMISGDIFTDRQTWGLLVLLLLIGAPEAIAASSRAVVGAIDGLGAGKGARVGLTPARPPDTPTGIATAGTGGLGSVVAAHSTRRT